MLKKMSIEKRGQIEFLRIRWQDQVQIYSNQIYIKELIQKSSVKRWTWQEWINKKNKNQMLLYAVYNKEGESRKIEKVIVGKYQGFPGGASGKEPSCQCRRPKKYGFDPWVGKIP